MSMGRPRKIKPCGCATRMNDGVRKRHRDSCPLAGRKGGPISKAERARVSNVKVEARRQSKAERMAQMRARAVRKFNFSTLHLVPSQGASQIPGFKWATLDHQCAVCGEETSANVDLRTLRVVVCDACNLIAERGVQR